MRGFAVLLILAALWLVPSIATAQDNTAGPAAQDDPATSAAADDDEEGEGEDADEADESEQASAPEPQGDAAAAALKVFTTHCARCHQEGSLVDRPKPAGGFGFVLDLDALARNPEYVQAGNPSASQIYSRIVNQTMPKDMDYVTVFGPSAEETKAVEAWINSLGEAATATIASREFIEDEAVVDLIANDIKELSDFERPRVRYFTLTHLYNAGDTDAEMEVYRQALSKMLNSLSLESGIVVPVPVDEQKTVFRVDITDLGWDAELWRDIEQVDPYFIEYDTPVMQFLQTETRTTVPFVRADWFTFVATQPPLYYDILGLPKTTPELERKLGVDTSANRLALRVARAGFQQSGVSRNNRMIERHSLSTGAYWESFDFSGNKERQSFFLFPLGPQNAFGDFSIDFGFVHDGGEVIFNLPNGLQGYYLTDARGNRLDKGPTNIVQDPSRRDQAVTNGISCMSCHDKGMQLKNDQVRDYVLSNIALPKEARDIIEEIFPVKEDWDELQKKDMQRFLDALKLAGVDPNLKLAGEEIVSSLFLRFERDLTIEQAAAEIGMDQETFKARLDMGSAQTFALKQRLSFNLVPRDQFVELFADLVNEITENKAFDLRERLAPGAIAINDPNSSKRFDLALFPNEEEFRVGGAVTLTVKPDLDCFLTLINVDQQGRTTVLFPNKFNQDNKVLANQELKVPGDKIGGFQLIFRDPGKETVIAKCNASGNRFPGIEHNFDQSAFTTFGDYDEYVTRALDPKKRQIVVVGTGESSGASSNQTTQQTAARLPPPVEPTPGYEAPPVDYDADVDIVAEQGIVLKVQP
jgi:mono/diheme cytochrome c family protein